MKSKIILSVLVAVAVVVLLALGLAPVQSFFAASFGSTVATPIRLVDDLPAPNSPSALESSASADPQTNPNPSLAPNRKNNGFTSGNANSRAPNFATPAPTKIIIARVPTQSANTAQTASSQTTFFDSHSLFVYVPPDAAKRQSLRVVIALHGMGGEGSAFASTLVSQANQNGWVVIAPTIAYQNYLDIGLLTQDDLNYSRELVATLDLLPKKFAGLHLHKRASLYGFSRGAQFAHRFALLYPDRVFSVAAMSAGAYTLPYEERSQDGKTTLLPFPFGIADLQQRVGHAPNYAALKQVKFFIAVGGNDNHASDVASAFDPYIGHTRVERATAFENALKALGIDARLVILPNTGHECTPEMQSDAMKFLHEVDASVTSGD